MAATLETRVRLLAGVPLLSNLRETQLAALADAADVREVGKSASVCTAGTPSPGMVVLARGRLTRDGIEIGPGEAFDELEAFDVRNARSTVTAIEDSEVLVLSARAVFSVVRADVETGVALLREASRHLVLPTTNDPGEQMLRYAADFGESFREGERRHAALRQSVMGTVRALVALAESKDPSSAGHASRAARLARGMAVALGDDEEKVGHAALGGLLHDIGLLAVDRAVIGRNGPLPQAEQAQIEAHPELGARIIQHLDFLRPVVPFVLHHHERYDGRGYPRGLSGRAIPREGRLLAAVESWETLRAAAAPADRDDRARLIVRFLEQVGRQLDREMAVILVRVVEAEESGLSDAPTVLVVDDDDLVTRIVAMTLQGGPRVLRAGNAADALKLARSARPKAIFLDVQLGGEDGVRLCRRLKADPDTKDIHIFMLSADDRPATRQRAKLAGAEGFFAKPFSPLALWHAVDEIVSS